MSDGLVVPARPVSQRLARLVTEVFAPTVLLVAALLAVGIHAAGVLAGLGWGLLAGFFLVGAPMAFVVVGVRRRQLTDHYIGVREHRRVPFLFALGCVAVGLTLLLVAGAPRAVVGVVVTMLVLLVSVIAVTHWWKISVHAGGAAAVVVMMSVDLGPELLASAPVVALVGWSRVRLGAHTASQVMVGAVLGALVAGAVFPLVR